MSGEYGVVMQNLIELKNSVCDCVLCRMSWGVVMEQKRPPCTASCDASWQPPITSSGDFDSMLSWWFAPYELQGLHVFCNSCSSQRDCLPLCFSSFRLVWPQWKCLCHQTTVSYDDALLPYTSTNSAWIVAVLFPFTCRKLITARYSTLSMACTILFWLL